VATLPEDYAARLLRACGTKVFILSAPAPGGRRSLRLMAKPAELPAAIDRILRADLEARGQRSLVLP